MTSHFLFINLLSFQNKTPHPKKDQGPNLKLSPSKIRMIAVISPVPPNISVQQVKSNKTFLFKKRKKKSSWSSSEFIPFYISVSCCGPLLLFFPVNILLNIQPCYWEGGIRLKVEAEKKWKILKASALQVWFILTGCIKILCVLLGCKFGILCAGQIVFEMQDRRERESEKERERRCH